MAPDMDPERYAEHMTAEQQLAGTHWPNDNAFERAITWACALACALAWCLLCWLGLGWYFGVLPDWSWL